MKPSPWRFGLLGVISLISLTACQPQNDVSNNTDIEVLEGDPVTQACQGFEDQEACQQVVQSCLDSGGAFESIALIDTADNEPMFNIVCRGPEADATADPIELPLPEVNDSGTTPPAS